MATKRIAKYFNIYDDNHVKSLECLVALTSLLSGYHLIHPSSHPVFADPVFKEVIGLRMSWFQSIGQQPTPVDENGMPRDPAKHSTLDRLNASVSNKQRLQRRSPRR